ncbi:nuclear transport factor 2 family protein [Noviherbaspirillum massiliense]|uniref:nuclear transport factor 2 family protein n=1 Tax=Noviherbaspirillum massiliense TaxID=1465823 RepID=UPI0002ED5521|nr:nuclear transport factor 2 family protein [Noviherbaspirillum massiliense]
MNQQQAKETADRFIEELHHLEDGDAAGADRLAQLFAPDAELVNPVIERTDGSRHGQEQIAAFWREYASSFGSIHSDFFDIMASDHSAGLFWRSSGTSAAGQPLNYEGVSLLVFDDAGKIARFQGFFDTRQMTLKSAH